MRLTRVFGMLRRALRDPRVVRERFEDAVLNHAFRWTEARGIRTRVYRRYEDYLRHQRSKLGKIDGTWLPVYDVSFRAALRGRLESGGMVPRGTSVPCLAARIGTEVKAFLDLGCFAVGLDLNPGKDNRYVVSGDFHDIQYPDACVEVVFCNSLDHALDLARLAGEIRRVLRPGGLAILEIARGTEEGARPGYYEASSWATQEQALDVFRAAGFEVVTARAFAYPWPGDHVVMRSRPRGA
jgi:SAM-dependent methyltransferase